MKKGKKTNNSSEWELVVFLDSNGNQKVTLQKDGHIIRELFLRMKGSKKGLEKVEPPKDFSPNGEFRVDLSEIRRDLWEKIKKIHKG